MHLCTQVGVTLTVCLRGQLPHALAAKPGEGWSHPWICGLSARSTASLPMAGSKLAAGLWLSMLCRHSAGQEHLSHLTVAVQAEAVNPQSLGMLAQLMHQTEQAETSEAACNPARLHARQVMLCQQNPCPTSCSHGAPHLALMVPYLRLELLLACQALLAGICESW